MFLSTSSKSTSFAPIWRFYPNLLLDFFFFFLFFDYQHYEFSNLDCNQDWFTWAGAAFPRQLYRFPAGLCGRAHYFPFHQRREALLVRHTQEWEDLHFRINLKHEKEFSTTTLSLFEPISANHSLIRWWCNIVGLQVLRTQITIILYNCSTLPSSMPGW